MSTYPSIVDNSTSLPYPTANSPRNNPSLAALQGSQNDALIALETKLGTGNSTPTANTFLTGNGVGASAWANTVPAGTVVGTTDTQILTNKTLTAPTITNATVSANTITGFTTSNTGTIYGVPITAGVIQNANTVNGSALTSASITSASIKTNSIFYATNATQTAFSVTGNYISQVWTNAPAGDLLFTMTTSMLPTAGNSTVNLSFTGTPTPTVQAGSSAGAHSSDADYSATKYLHRTSFARVVGWPGGNLTITVQVVPEASSSVTLGQSGDARWATTVTGMLAIGV